MMTMMRKRWRIVAFCGILATGSLTAQEVEELKEVEVRVVDVKTGEKIPTPVVLVKEGDKVQRIALGKDGKVPVPKKGERAVTIQLVSGNYYSLARPFSYGHIGALKGKPFVLKALPGRVRKGRVLDEQGNPLANTPIVLRASLKIDTRSLLGEYTKWAMATVGHNWIVSTRSDAQGRYEITVPKLKEADWVQVSVAREGFAERLYDHASVQALRDIKLSRGVLVRPRILDSKGKARAGVAVSWIDPHRPNDDLSFGVSGEDGRLPGLRLMPGTYDLSVPKRIGLKDLKTAALDDLQLPYEAQTVRVPAEQENFEVDLKSIPDRLVQFEWDEQRKEAGSWTGLALGPVVLMVCEIDGKVRACGRLPDDGTREVYLRRLQEAPEGVYSVKVHAELPTALAKYTQKKLRLRDGKGVMGSILAEQPARVEVTAKGRGGVQLTNFGTIAVSVRGRFGERSIRTFWSGYDKFLVDNIYPGESVSFHAEHEKFEPIRGKEKEMKAGETRKQEFKLVARVPQIWVSVHPVGEKDHIHKPRILVGLPDPERGKDKVKWSDRLLKRDANWNWRYTLDKGRGQIKLKIEKDGFETKVSDWIDSDLPRQQLYFRLKRLE